MCHIISKERGFEIYTSCEGHELEIYVSLDGHRLDIYAGLCAGIICIILSFVGLIYGQVFPPAHLLWIIPLAFTEYYYISKGLKWIKAIRKPVESDSSEYLIDSIASNTKSVTSNRI